MLAAPKATKAKISVSTKVIISTQKSTMVTTLPGWTMSGSEGPGAWKQTGGSLASGSIDYQCKGDDGICCRRVAGGIEVNGTPQILFPVDPTLPVETLTQD